MLTRARRGRRDELDSARAARRTAEVSTLMAIAWLRSRGRRPTMVAILRSPEGPATTLELDPGGSGSAWGLTPELGRGTAALASAAADF